MRQVRAESKAVAAWGGTDPWLSFREFSNMLHSPPYSVLLNCERWQVHLLLGRSAESSILLYVSSARSCAPRCCVAAWRGKDGGR